jgi:hypothetical protein
MSDTLTQAEGIEIFADLAESAPLELLLEMSKGGEPVTGSGFADGDVTAIEITPPSGGDPLRLVFPTCMIAHRFANFFALGPRPTEISEGAMGLVRQDLDDRVARTKALASTPGEVRAALDHDDALRWALTLRDRGTQGELFSRKLEIYDCVEGGIWIVLDASDAESPDAVALTPADSTTVWRGLSTLLPTDDELAAITAAG